MSTLVLDGKVLHERVLRQRVLYASDDTPWYHGPLMVLSSTTNRQRVLPVELDTLVLRVLHTLLHQIRASINPFQ